jgi:hypothetical protein
MIDEKKLIRATIAAKLSIFLISIGVIVVFGSLFYATYKIRNLQAEISNLNKTRDKLEKDIKQKNYR